MRRRPAFAAAIGLALAAVVVVSSCAGAPAAGVPPRFPEALRDVGWPLFACAVGCGVLLGIAVGIALVIGARRRRRAADHSPTRPI